MPPQFLAGERMAICSNAPNIEENRTPLIVEIHNKQISINEPRTRSHGWRTTGDVAIFRKAARNGGDRSAGSRFQRLLRCGSTSIGSSRREVLRERQQLICHLFDMLSHRKTFQPALRNPRHSIHRACQLSVDRAGRIGIVAQIRGQ